MLLLIAASPSPALTSTQLLLTIVWLVIERLKSSRNTCTSARAPRDHRTTDHRTTQAGRDALHRVPLPPRSVGTRSTASLIRVAEKWDAVDRAPAGLSA